MLIGGFQRIDPALLLPEPRRTALPLRCDLQNEFGPQIFTNNGRTATVYLLARCLRCAADEHVLIPDYLCISVLAAFEEVKTKFRVYRVDKDMNIDMDDLRGKIDGKTRAVYIIHYFGVPHSEEVARQLQEIRAQNGIRIIEDITQSLFSRHPARMGYGDYLVCSTRKWMPMTDGGLLAARAGVPFRRVGMPTAYNDAAYNQLMISLLRDYMDAHPEEDVSFYLEMERQANRTRYDDLRPRRMTEASRRIMLNADYQALIRRRRANYRYLYGRLKGIRGLRIASPAPAVQDDCVPFGFLLLTENRDGLYRYLAEEKQVIGEIQWELPLNLYDPGEDARWLSEHNLMLHCDQRYGPEEMEIVAEAVEAFFRR